MKKLRQRHVYRVSIEQSDGTWKVYRHFHGATAARWRACALSNLHHGKQVRIEKSLPVTFLADYPLPNSVARPFATYLDGIGVINP